MVLIIHFIHFISKPLCLQDIEGPISWNGIHHSASLIQLLVNSLFNTGVSERPNSWISIAILKNVSVCFSLSCFLVLISCLYVQICPLLLQSFAWEHVYFVKRRDQHLISLLCHADCRTSLTGKAKANQNWHSGLTLNKAKMLIEKNEFAKLITEKCVALLGISLSRVLGSGTMGALGMTGRFTACVPLASPERVEPFWQVKWVCYMGSLGMVLSLLYLLAFWTQGLCLL